MKNLLLKNFFKLLFLFLFLMQSPVAIAYDPSASVDATWSDKEETLSDKRVSDNTINQSKDYNPESSDNKAFTDNRAGKVLENEKYFHEITFTSCESPSDLVCPPLLSDKQGENLRSRIDFIDLKNGEISCSIYRAIDYGQALSKASETPIHRQKFVNSACVEKYSGSTNIDESDEVKNLITENEDYIKDLQQQKFKYDEDYKTNGDDVFLDWADVVDGLVTFNSEIFDLEQTLLTRSLKTKNGYTILPNEIILEKFEQNLSNLFSRVVSGSWANNAAFVDGVETQARIRNIADAMADSNYFMLLEFFIKANDVFILIMGSIGALFIGYNVVAGWLLPALGNKVMKKDSGENNLHRAVYGIFMLIAFSATNTEVINVEYKDYDGVYKEQLEINQTNMQKAGQLLFSSTNWLSDVIAGLGFDASSAALNSSTGLLSGDQIKALASERMILKKEQESLAFIDKDMCAANYDLFALTDILSKYRTKTLNTKEGSENLTTWKFWETDNISSLRANPYPKSEREANAMMYYGYSNNESPYNSVKSNHSNGVVKSSSQDKFRSSTYSPLSLSGCYNNKKRMIYNDSRLRAIEEEFNKFDDVEEKENKVEYLRMLNEVERKLYAEWGYPAIVFLPVKHLLADNLGIVGDAMKKQEQLEANSKSGESLDGASIKVIGENIVLLSIFGGYQIAQVIHTIKSGVVDVVGNVTGPMSGVAKQGLSFFSKYMTGGAEGQEVDLIDLGLASILLQASLDTMVITVIVVGGAFAFTLLFIEKLYAFMALMFLIFYTFHKNQEEKVLSAIVKVFAVAFKTVLITICVVLSIFALGIVEKFEIVMLNEFFNSLDMIENKSWEHIFNEKSIDNVNIFSISSLFIKKYVFYSVAKVSFAVLKILLMIKIIFTMPSFLYELVYEKAANGMDNVADTMLDATRQQTVRV